MHITMVKKELADGQPCKKCLQAEEMLRVREVWDRIDEVVIADEADPQSDGMKLGAKYEIDIAPFFIVEDGGEETVFTSIAKFLKQTFPDAKRPSRKGTGTVDTQAALDELQGQTPQEIVNWALSRYGNGCGLAFSGAEDVALIDMAVKSGHAFTAFCLDTGRLHPETYDFIERVRDHYAIDISLMSPQTTAVESLVREKGLFSFYRDGHGECCAVRKVEPLRRALSKLDAWITGQRLDQSPATRSDLNVIETDMTFSGRGAELIKFNPLAAWSSSQVWAYIREERVPYNALHDQGFISIGCQPCTRASRPGEHERAARWWWEDETQRECGLHTGASD
jgi:phosphoadenosine phosphosulfate reductase